MPKKIPSSRLKSVLGHAIRAMITSALLIVLIGYFEVNHVLHPPRIIPTENTLRKYQIQYQSLDLVTEDGVRLSAWYTPSRNGVVILLAHGYGEHRPEWLYVILAKKGFGVLAWDARAHGESGGEISTGGYLEVLDAKAALDAAAKEITDVMTQAGYYSAATKAP